MSSNSRNAWYWAIGIVGILLVLAPFVLGYDGNDEALWTSLILGGVTAVVMIYKALAHDDAAWEYWLAGIAGVLAVLAPFVLGFDNDDSALWSNLILGVVAVLGVGYVGASNRSKTA